MIRALILRRLNGVEKDLGESVDYLRHIARTSIPAFLRFTKALGLVESRKTLPLEPFHLARLVATRAADCGTCAQIELNLARQAGLAEPLLRAVIAERPEDLPDGLAAVYRFTESVVQDHTHARGDEAELRAAVRSLHGEKGLVELALAIGGCRVFPMVKRTLGYSTACSNDQLH